MDVSKYRKPIHFTCPKCRSDFEFAGGKLVKEKNELAQRLSVIEAKMQNRRNECGKDAYYYKLLKEKKDILPRYTAVKQAVQLASEQSEIHLFIMFKKRLCEKYGKEEIIKLLQEFEDDLSYTTEELMRQKYNNFSGC